MGTIAFDKDDNILFGHSSYQKVEYGLGKLTSDGQLDTTFLPPIGKQGYINRGDYFEGKLVVGGDFVDLGGVHTRNIAIMDTKGAVDPAFQIKQDVIKYAANNQQASQLTFVDGDTIIVALSNRLLRINSKAQIDSTFVSSDIQAPLGWPEDTYYYVDKFELAGNKIITNSPNVINMFKSNGTRNLSFTEYYREVSGGFSPLSLQSNGIIIDLIQRDGGNQICRLNWNGTVDSSFNSITEPKAIFSEITTLKDDNLLVTGNFKQYGGLTTRSFVKLYSNGEINNKVTTNFLNTAPDYTYLKYNRRFREGYLVSGYSSNDSLSVGFIKTDGTFVPELRLPEEVYTTSEEIFPVVAGHDTVFLFSSFHFHGQSETNSVVKLAFNDRPIIHGTVADLSTPQNLPLSVSLDDLIVVDNNSNYLTDFSLRLLPGAHYTVDDTSIQPHSGFVGTLSVPVVVNDGKYDSDPYAITINVIPPPEPIIVTINIDTLTFQHANIAITFSEEVKGFTPEDIMIEGAVLTDMFTSDSVLFTATLLGVPESTAWVYLPENRVQNASGAVNSVSDTLKVNFPAVTPMRYTITLSVEDLAPATTLTATLFQQQQGVWNVDTIITTETTALSLTGLPAGTYTLSIQVKDTSCITSYLGEVLTLAEAQKIELSQDTVLSVTMLWQSVASTPGSSEMTGVIEGVLLQRDVDNGRLQLGEQLAEGDPISQVAVYLLDENQYVVARTFTNEKGYFRFEGLPEATYRLRADHQGLMHEASLDQITIDSTHEILQLSVIAGSTLWLESITIQEQPDDENQITALPGEVESTLRYFPNPVSDRLTLTGLAAGNGGRVQLLDIIGNKVLDEAIANPMQQLQLSSLPSGIYILMIRQGTQQSTYRIQKQ
ncbi:T9SS type A sorting domain-containing protein [Porifericola rhodea]|uniref:carboxypeptidase regulatory-like domain-containing protein n=1 Tax=Porifericola rhodea TaxID=930972 RepID=UPI00266673A7|nr:carboxypeptidase regulatory-like domain-containing protein [Porifericola rhodea]WKN29955.1 T9SS type A sorting domain-containing protein [Porifericola rhodea]